METMILFEGGAQPPWTPWNAEMRGLREEYSDAERYYSYVTLDAKGRVTGVHEPIKTASKMWQENRAIGMKRRAEWVRRALAGDPDLSPRPVVPEWLANIEQDERLRAKFTPAQLRALRLTYGLHLTQREAAEAAGCRNRSAYQKQLAGAHRALAIVLQAVAEGRPSTVRRGKNRGRANVREGVHLL
jgi:predicted DNA-binding protein (UPF0251 family)